MEIREITHKDLTACADIFSRTFSSEPWNEEWNITSALERLTCFFQSEGFCGVLAEEDNVVCFVMGNIEPFYSGPIFYLREMCTDMDNQSRGIGSQTLQFLEEKLRSKRVNNVYLLTEHGIPAAQFYQNRGFNVDRNTEFYSKNINS